jgi:hypothetical protein
VGGAPIKARWHYASTSVANGAACSRLQTTLQATVVILSRDWQDEHAMNISMNAAREPSQHARSNKAVVGFVGSYVPVRGVKADVEGLWDHMSPKGGGGPGT